MSANFHPLVYIIDYILGVIMWTLIGRVAMNIFQREDSNFFFMKVFVKLTDPLINSFRVITPSFIIKPLVPLYVAWFFYMLRFYLMPWLLGYTVMGMLTFPLESEIAGLIYRFLSPQWILFQEQILLSFPSKFHVLWFSERQSFQILIILRVFN